MKHTFKILDCHVHSALQNDSEMLDAFLRGNGTDMANIIACSHSTELSLVPQALKMKLTHPKSYFVFAAPDASAYKLNPYNLGEYLAEYTKLLTDAGCDGIKLLEGKPQMRKMYDVPNFDLPVWEAFWDYLEDEQIPVLWHVNDPENFWDKEQAPSFAVSQGWLYDESYVNNEEQYSQVLTVLNKHPGLKICFAHFFFMSAQLDRLSEIFDRYPNVMVDLTPGIEMYENFSKNINHAAEFFKKYHNRICYGTDIGGRCVLMGEDKAFDFEENKRRPEVVRKFLEYDNSVLVQSDGHYLINRSSFTMHCLGLSEERLEEIYFGNFLRLTGGMPKSTSIDKITCIETYINKRKDLLYTVVQ